MSSTARELWTVIYGMGLGTIFLFTFAGVLARQWSLRRAFVAVRVSRSDPRG